MAHLGLYNIGDLYTTKYAINMVRYRETLLIPYWYVNILNV